MKGPQHVPRPSTPSLIGPDYTEPGLATPSRLAPQTVAWGALNSETMTVGPDRPETNEPARVTRWSPVWHPSPLKRAPWMWMSQRPLVSVCAGYVWAVPYFFSPSYSPKLPK